MQCLHPADVKSWAWTCVLTCVGAKLGGPILLSLLGGTGTGTAPVSRTEQDEGPTKPPASRRESQVHPSP